MRVRGELGKKLVAALRWELDEAPKNEWLLKVKQEDPSAAVNIKEKPSDAEWPWYAEFYRKALADLSCDRQLLPMGGVTPLSFQTISNYANHYGIIGENFETFCYVLRRLDRVCVEKANKTNG